MAINELTAIVAPPTSPMESGNSEQWASVQDSLRTRLPDDFREFGQVFGSGSFIDDTIRVFIFNPFSPTYLDKVKERHCLLEGMKIGEGDLFVPYEVFPKSPGLLAWGDDDNGNELFWLTKGSPNRWSVIVRSNEGDFQSFKGPMSSFLAQVFQRRIRPDIWPDPFFPDPTTIRFEPELQVTQPATNSVYELYIENGNSAGFWVRKTDAQPGIIHFIKAVNGQQSGPLPGIPVEYNRARVDADSYLNGELDQSDVKLSNAYVSVFVRVPSPNAKQS